MTLRLRVVSEHRRSLGDRNTVVFTVNGGMIGRSADNDWVLPDPHRYISAHHARVHFREGHYYLIDVSTNGVFVNDAPEPLSKRGPEGYKLRNGDVVRMGEYEIVVALESQPELTAHDVAAAVPTSIHALHTLGRAAQTDIGAMLDLESLLVPDGAIPDSTTGDNLLQVNAYGQAVAQAPATKAAARRTLPPPATHSTDPDEESLARRMARLAKAAGRDPKTGASPPALQDVHTGLQAFCRGAGIDVERLPADAQTRMLHLAGQLFREALVGFKDLERTQSDVRNRFRIEVQQPEPDDPRPSLARLMVEDLLYTLLLQHESRRLDAVQWLREAVAEAKNHENATAHATRAAFVEFTGRLDPAELEARFERTARRSKGKPADKEQYWDLFATFYRNLIEMPADHLPHTFVEAFATAYREFLKKPG